MGNDIYVKFRVEGWVQVNEEIFNKYGMSLETMAYEMSEGNGICTLWTELVRETEDNHPTMEDSALSFFTLSEYDEDKAEAFMNNV